MAMIQPWHRKVQIDGCVEPVDAGIAELLQALWAKGLRTEQSCEDWGTLLRQSPQRWGPAIDLPVGWAYIKFTTQEECARFAATLGSHMVWGSPPGEGDPMFVSFPTEDIPRITEAWK